MLRHLCRGTFKALSLGKLRHDSGKVSDHHAIIPTMELAKTDISTLPESERNILTLAGARLIFAAAAPSFD